MFEAQYLITKLAAGFSVFSPCVPKARGPNSLLDRPNPG